MAAKKEKLRKINFQKRIITIVSLIIALSNLQAESWKPCNLAVNGNNTWGTSVCVHNGKVFATNNSNGLMMSADNGETWTVVNSKIVAPGVNLYSTGDRLYSLLHNSGCTYLQYSIDDGVTFQIDTIGLPLCYVNASTTPSCNGKAWKNHLMFSFAGPDWEFTRNTQKAGWDAANYFDPNDCSEFFVKNDTCWAATNGATSNGVAWSIDGLDWTSPVSKGIPNYYVPTNIAWSNNRLLMMGMDVGARNAGVDTILKYSDDYGLNFKDYNIKKFLAKPVQSTYDIFSDYNHIYFTLSNDLNGSAPDLIVSTDGGETFTNDVEGFPEVPNTVFVINNMAFLNGWVFAQLNTGDLFRKQIALVGGTENTLAETSIKVFPNPAENQIKISTESEVKQIKIYKISGEIIAAEKQNTIDITSYKPGVYLLKVETADSKTHHSKIIKIQ